ncbi:GyrI-like domain-containing protein [Corynebacterium sp.]|uniref:GyrI-like domain-containing protein n=1 Tax=Corynebacterium sp. TaxID=1720 RepID=UPI0026DF319B|nr:GyrI-like domain-containing protein [Corynebacterium sp.]MDO5511311.1 hypothetical protein [Corynebacterium sp.]
MTQEISLPAHAIIAIRETIATAEMPAFFDRVYTRLGDVLAASGAHPAGPARAYYHTPLTDTVDVSAAFPLPAEQVAAVEAEAPDLVHHLPDVTALTMRHHGAYDSLGNTWQELVEAATATGREMGPLCWEEYVTEPSPEADPADMITDLYVTLA